MKIFVLSLCATLASTALGEVHTLRMATPIPEGSAWWREMRAFAREVDRASDGQAQVRWYYGGIAGDELTALERIKRGQLDGAAGSIFCDRLAPTLKVARLAGIYRSRQENNFMLDKLRPVFDEELLRAGFISLGVVTLGPTIVLSRRPFHSLDELKRVRLWRWDIDALGRMVAGEMGLSVVPTPLDQAGRAYDEGRLDGFLALSTAALAFQWTARASYFTELPLDYLVSCLVVSAPAFDALPLEQQQIVRTAAAKLAHRFESVNATQDQLLMGGLLERQGLRRVVLDDALRREAADAATAAQERLGDKLLPRSLYQRTLNLLEERRAEQAAREHP
jgi:TRAP-type C4-dicarboxylate transport system substrate-binding protein